MPWRTLARLIGLKVPPQTACALSYLERAGLRFCVDFGTENAIEKARAHWRARRRKK